MIEESTHKIIVGDSRNMSELNDKSVQLVVTSPPYWQLKDYGSEEQIGFNDSYENYINNLNLVWKECYRVLDDGCRLCVNIGDQFARSVYYGRYKVIPIHSEIIRFCENLGFDFMGQIIWQKSTTMNTTGGGAVMGSFPYPRNGIVKLDFEYILLFKKQGIAPKPTKEQKAASQLTNEEWNTYFNGHWYFNGARQDKHLAMFPVELPHRLIKMFSFVGDTVLDPFMGSGTTSLAARKLNRNSVGYEINNDFIPIAKNKIAQDSNIFSNVNIEIVHQLKEGKDWETEIMQLPYQFVDVHKMDKKIDVKKLQFGSKIDGKSEKQNEEMFTVKEVISPELVRLSNELTVRLIGVVQDKEVNGAATEYLQKKFKGKKVFLRFDNEKYDADNHLLVYLYLENKTFINAHLIKNGLVKVDESMEYKYKDKFLKMK